ncbi:MAG: hypothetical protein AB1631_33070, partial [Acidobacteriota bacterium]
KIRPQIYLARVEGSHLNVNFVVSGTRNGFPFQSSDLVASSVTLFEVNEAEAIDFKVGGYPEALPDNLSRFPDGFAHSLVAHGWASFRITNQIKDSLDSIESSSIKLKLANGRPVAYTGLPTENPVYMLHDILTDPIHSIGLPSSLIDTSALSASVAYASTRYQGRFELHEQRPLIEVVQDLLRDFHGFITFNGGKVQIGVKRNDEGSSPVIFGTGGRTIIDNHVEVEEKDSSEIINQAAVSYRLHNRHLRQVIMYDKPAQLRAGNGIEKVVEEEWESVSLYDDTQVMINGAILVREEQNANLFITFRVPLNDGLDVAPGDVIRVNNINIPNNASNYLFRIMTQTFTGPGEGVEQEIEITAQVYKASVYADTADPFGTDILRTSSDTSIQGRPPDVTPVSLTLVDVSANDKTGKLATVRATWTYPIVDLATEQSNDIYREYPIVEVALFWRYTDQKITEAQEVKRVKYPTTQADFQIDHDKNRSIEVFFVAIGHNHARAPLGYIQDTTKATNLTSNLAANVITANVKDTTAFAANDYVRCENEFNRVLSKTATTLTFYNDGANRTTFFDSSSIAHPSGTEIAVAKPSYPSLILALSPPRFTYPIVTGLAARQRNDGVRFKWSDPNADNREVFYLYYSTDADADTNAAKLGSAAPSWYLTDPNTPGTGVTLIKVDDLSHKVLQEEIGAAGTLVYARVAARNGKHNWSSQLSAIASNRLGDDAVPTVSAAPKVHARKQGIKVRAILPTTNMQTFGQSGKVEHVIRAKNAGGSILGYLSDDTSGSFTSSASEFRFDQGKSPGHFYNFNREAALALWPTVATLEIYVYVWNAVGPSAASSIVTVTVSTWEVGDVPQDSAAPTISVGPNFKYGSGAFRVNQRKSTLSNVNNPTLVEITINNGTNSLNLDDLDAETPASGIVFFDIGKTSFKDSIPIPKQRIRRIFALTDTLVAALRITNNAGTTTGPNSSGLSVATLKDINPAQNPFQILRNAELAFKDASGDLDIWQKYNAQTGGFSDVPVGSGDLRFEDTSSEVKWHQNSATDKRYLVQKLGNIIKRSQPLA